jgi:YHS domain-containing protein
MKVLTTILLLATVGISYAQDTKLRREHFNINKENVSNDGYDPVSYFDGTPLQGKEEFSYAYGGVTYWFATDTNRSKFKKAPLKYEPQYGGWCAYALGLEAEKVKVDPETYKIVDGKLYLFYNFYLTNTLKSWNKDEMNLMTNANKNWKKVIK